MTNVFLHWVKHMDLFVIFNFNSHLFTRMISSQKAQYKVTTLRENGTKRVNKIQKRRNLCRLDYCFQKEDQDVGGRIIIGWILERWDGVMWTGLVWLRVRTGGEILWIRYWTFGFHKMLGNYRVAEHLVASRVVLSSIELVSYTIDLWGV
jgi:hypothetical protein